MSRFETRTGVIRDDTKIYVNGQWVPPLSGTTVDIVNPATQSPAGRISLATAADVDLAVKAARTAFKTFSLTTRKQRIGLLQSIAGVYSARRQDLADALTEELGAPAKLAFEIHAGGGLRHLRAAIETLEHYVFEHPQGSRTAVRREPLGAIGMITSWNWPINQILSRIAPALATGNTIVHKPSSVTPFTAHIIAEILHEAGVPKGVYNLVDGTGLEVGAAISLHRDVAMMSFTGSTAAGIEVARYAAGSGTRMHRQPGGKSANIVLEDADMEKAVSECVQRLMLNSGQTCHAPAHLLVPLDRLEEAEKIAAQVAGSLRVGDPQTDVHLGPVASQRQWNRIQSLILEGREEGATVLIGGEGRPQGLKKGYYVKPTIFTRVESNMTIAREEIFGPVLCILSYRSEDEAVAIANSTNGGLVAYVQSASDERAARVAARLEAGTIFLNGVGEDAEAPFNGMNAHGREWSEVAFDEFLDTKTVIHRRAM